MGATLYYTQPENNAKIYLSCIIISVLNICLCILLEHFASFLFLTKRLTFQYPMSTIQQG